MRVPHVLLITMHLPNQGSHNVRVGWLAAWLAGNLLACLGSDLPTIYSEPAVQLALSIQDPEQFESTQRVSETPGSPTHGLRRAHPTMSILLFFNQ